MNISHDSAMRIVTEMSSVIGHDVNMMDERGIIIASTDPERFGTFHGGARELLQQGLSELVVSDDRQYPGARQGINLPICFEGATVGVIGITGRGTEVQQYSQIIKKMTEILLLDSWGERQKQLRAAMWSQFMEEWLFSSAESVTDRFVERGLELGIDIRKPFQIFVVALEQHDAAEEQERLGCIEEAVRQVLREAMGGFYYKLPFRYVCFVSPVSEEKLREMACHVYENVERCGFRSFIGIDAEPVDCRHVRGAYDRAGKALRAAVQNGDRYAFYNGFDMEFIAGEISLKTRQDFIASLFRDCSKRDCDEIMEFLPVYFRCNGSIQTVAKELCLHKNTVQYKLRRIYKLTRLDPRNLKNAAIFEVALAILKTLRSDSTTKALHL
ncbi:MAG: CdaR family transcriptional regulator [Pyramidobacter sp.]|jgi:carbohydrate diacid regulator